MDFKKMCRQIENKQRELSKVRDELRGLISSAEDVFEDVEFVTEGE